MSVIIKPAHEVEKKKNLFEFDNQGIEQSLTSETPLD